MILCCIFGQIQYEKMCVIYHEGKSTWLNVISENYNLRGS